jgi:outer membrane protein TolC
MRVGIPTVIVLWPLLVSPTVVRGETLSLERATAMALANHPDVLVARAAKAEADEQASAARSSWFPRVTLHEGWMRGNQPVFVFGALLNQRRFTAANFAIDALNHPDAVSDYRAAMTVRQPLFDPAATTALQRTARAAASLAEVGRRQAAGDAAVQVAETYGQVLRAEAARQAAEAAVEAGRADRDRAASRRDAGLVSDADVLAIDVHLARMRAGVITARNDARTARLALNRLIGAPPETAWDLVLPADAPERTVDAAAIEAALAVRSDVAASTLQVAVAEAGVTAARAALLPRVAVEGGVDWNGGTWSGRASSWALGVRAELSLSAGLGEAAAARAARRRAERARAEQAGVTSAARVDLEAARGTHEAAMARRDVGLAAVAQAREGERIVRDRYDAGLATVADLLRAGEAVIAADALATTARVDAVVSAVALDRALGRITPEGPP